MSNRISDAKPRIDIWELEQSQNLESALELMSGANARFSYSSLAYYGMIALRPHVPGLQFGGDAISCEDPYQGLLYHYLITQFLCFRCFKGYYVIPGLSIVQVPTDPTRPNDLTKSNCQRAFEASTAKFDELTKYLEDKNMPVPDFSAYFFNKNPQVPVLPGDMVVHDQEYDLDFQDFDHFHGGGDEYNLDADLGPPPPPPPHQAV